MLMSSADPAPLFCEVRSSAVIRKGDLQRLIKKNIILTSSVDEAGSRMIRVNIDTFWLIGDRRIPFKWK